MIASSIIFSVMGLMIRYGSDIPFYKTSLYRFAVGAISLGTLALFGRIKLDFFKRRVLFLRGLFGGISVVLFYMSIVKVGIAKGTVLSYTYPIFATLGGVIVLRDRVKPVVWVLSAVAMAGVAMLVDLSDLGGIDIWVILTLLGAVLAGAAIVCVKQLTVSDSVYTIYIAQCLIGFWIVVIPSNLDSSPAGWGVGLILVGIGLAALAAQLLMNWSFGRISIATGSLLGMLTPIFNVLIGLALFGETLSAPGLLGTALILVSCTGVVVWGGDDRGHRASRPDAIAEG